MLELTATTRERSVVTRRSSNRPVSAKGPRWLVAICNSKPSSGPAVGRPHDAGVVHQEVEPSVVGQDHVGGTAHRAEVGQVEVEQLE